MTSTGVTEFISIGGCKVSVEFARTLNTRVHESRCVCKGTFDDRCKGGVPRRGVLEGGVAGESASPSEAPVRGIALTRK